MEFKEMADGNPIVLKTRKAMRVLGKLAAEWAMDESTRPDNLDVIAPGRIFAVNTQQLMDFLSDPDRPEEDRLSVEDLSFRDGVERVELIVRTPQNASILLPEPQVMASQTENKGQVTLEVPRIYDSIDFLSDGEQKANENYAVTFTQKDDEDALDAFLYPYLGSYICAQCI
jgi:hypothetical protein